MTPRPLNDREKKTVRIAVIGVAIYLVLFGGYEAWQHFDQKRREYRALADEARDLRQQTLPYQEKVLVVKKLMDEFHLDPARLKRDTVVSDASAAIQKAAKAGGLQLGSIRETPAHSAGKTLASVQLEGSGPAPAVLSFLAGLNIIGYPLVVDSVQFTADNRPGQVKMNLIILILDFDQQQEAGHA
jgi:hypothetical protein